MNKPLLLTLAATLLAGCRPTGFRYTLEGDIEGLADPVALIDDATADTLAVLPVTDGSFRYEGRYDQPTSLSLNSNGLTVGIVYLEPGAIRIEGKLDAAESSNRDKTVFYPSGTPANAAFGAHLRFWNRTFHALKTEDLDQARRAALFDSLQHAAERNLAANTDNIFGAAQIDVVQEIRGLSRAQVDSIVALFPPHLRNSRFMQQPLQRIERVFRSQELAEYADFAATDPDGRQVVLSEVLGSNRYVLLDFWFAACGPCRWEMPRIKAARQTYRERGFEVVGIARDKDAEAWKQAIAADGMTWVNLIDPDGRVCELYAVTKFPTNYLIDCATGKIVARDLQGTALAETLDELIGQ